MKNITVFADDELSMHRLKVLFICSFYSWSKLFVGNRPMSLVFHHPIGVFLSNKYFVAKIESHKYILNQHTVIWH